MKKIFFFFLLLPFANMQAQTVCSPATGNIDLDINNVRARMLGGGDMWWDLIYNAKYEVPKGSGHSTLVTGSIWLGV